MVTVINNQRSYANAEQFFQAHQESAKSCSYAQCLKLEESPQIKHIFEKFLELQAERQNKLTLSATAERPGLFIKNEDTGSSFSLSCENLFNPEEFRAFAYCDGYVGNEQKYSLQEERNHWEEVFVLGETIENHVLSNQENPKLFIEAFKHLQQPTNQPAEDLPKQEADLAHKDFSKPDYGQELPELFMGAFKHLQQPTNQPAEDLPKQEADLAHKDFSKPETESINPLHMAMGSVAVAVAVYAVYKAMSIAAKRWNGNVQPQKPEPSQYLALRQEKTRQRTSS